MRKRRRAGPIEVYAVFAVAMVAVLGLVSLYLHDVSHEPSFTGQITYGHDQGSGIARLPRISMSCKDMDAHMKTSQIYMATRAIGPSKSNGVGVFKDYCEDDRTLIENYCVGGKVIQQSVTCFYNCRDSACELYP